MARGLNGLRAQFGTRFGPLPIWAWALLAVLAIVGWMYVTKSGFFGAPSTGGIPADTSGSDPYGANPLGLGGLAGGGNPDSPNAASNPVPAYYDPNSGGYVGSGSSSADTGSTPSFDLAPYQNVAAAALGAASTGSGGTTPLSPAAQQFNSVFTGRTGLAQQSVGTTYSPSAGGATLIP